MVPIARFAIDPQREEKKERGGGKDGRGREGEKRKERERGKEGGTRGEGENKNKKEGKGSEK